MKVIDNFLSNEIFYNIKNNLVNATNFPWFLSHGVSRANDGFTQFTHFFYSDQIKRPHFELVLPLVHALKMDSIVRIKANLLFKTEKIIEHDYHVDINFNDRNLKCKTAVYYLNSNDGYTKFITGEVVNSVENRLVLFDSDVKHFGTTCTDNNIRVVLNLNWF